jgi:RimJ/RimL family protein N-acetyltransferase
MAHDPPYRVVTERLVIRCWDPCDAALLKEAVDASLDHLRAWMPWAHDDPQPLAEKVGLLRRFRGRFDLGQDFVYGLFDRAETEVVGGSGLHTRVGNGALEIGYWIRASRVGQGLATEATAALTRVAFAVAGVDRVEIRIDPANEASLAVPRKLGFVEEATLRRRLPLADPTSPRRDAVVFTLLAEEVDATPVAATALEAYDASGARIL